ncbi:hypothetical protein [Streptomyces sp. NPDC096153]|uniref:hypothetical protein n=1 Tax=Streptomyces sp. NPDC096153 TaxID=3155548 RepID=UPI00331E50A6
MPYKYTPDAWISTREAAQLLGLKPGTMRARRSEDRETLPYIRVAGGTVVLYQRAAVEKLAEEMNR